MPDNINQPAAFTEVFSVEADVNKFAQSLEQLEAAYRSFVERLGGQSTEVSNIGIFANINESLQNIVRTLDEVAGHSIQTFEALTATQLAGIKEVETATKESSASTTAARQQETAQIDGITRAELQLAEARRRNAELEGRAGFQEPLTQTQELEAVLQQIELTRTRINNLTNAGAGASTVEQRDAIRDLNSELEILLRKYKDLDTAQNKRVRNNDEAVDAAHLKALDEQLAGQDKLNSKYAESVRQIQTISENLQRLALNKDLPSQIQLLQDRLEAITIQLASFGDIKSGAVTPESLASNQEYLALLKQEQAAITQLLAAESKRASQDAASARELEAQAKAQERLQNSRIRSPQEAVDAANLRAIESEEAAQEKLNTQFQESVNKIQQIRDNLEKLSLNNNLTAQVELLQKRLDAVRAELQSLGTIPANVGGTVTSEALASNERYIDLLRQEEALVKQLASAQKSLASEQAATAKANEGFFDKLLGPGLLQSIVHLTRFILLWQVLQTVIEAVTAVIEAPFKFLKEGIDFLSKTQEYVDRLSGTLATNVKYSADFAENFRIARDTAGDVVTALRQVSVATGLPFQSLLETFEALSSSGAANAVKNTGELVQLTQLFEQALQGTGRSASNLKFLISQLPLFFNGSLKATSQIAEALNLSSDQLTNIVSSAKQHKDLVEQLTPLLANYVAASDAAKDSHEKIIGALQLELQQLEAIGAAPVFHTIDDFLKNVQDWLDKNHLVVELVVKLFGQLADQLLLIVARAFQTDVSLTPILTSILTSKLKWVSILGDVVNSLVAVLNITNKIAQASLNPFSDFKANVVQAILEVNQLNEDLKKSASLRKELDFAAHVSAIPPSEFDKRTSTNTPNLDRTITGIRKTDLTPDASSKAHSSSKSEFDQNIAETKEYYQNLKNIVKEGESDLSISRTSAEKILSDILDKEQTELDAFADEYKRQLIALSKAEQDRIKSLKDTPPVKRQALLDANDQDLLSKLASLGKQESTIRTSIERERTAITVAANNERHQIDQQNFKASIALAQQESSQKLAIAKAEAAEGLLTEVQLLDKEREIADQRHQIQVREINQQLATPGQNGNPAVGTPQRNEILNRQIQEEQSYTNEIEALTHRRIALLIAEQKARQEFADTIRQLNIQTLETQQAINAQVVGFSTPEADKNLFDAKQQNLQILQQEKARELELALARNEGTESVLRYTLQLKELYKQELSLFQQRVQQSLQGVNTPIFQRVIASGLGSQQERSLQDRVDASRSSLDALTASHGNVITDPVLIAQFQALSLELKNNEKALQDLEGALQHPTLGQEVQQGAESFLGKGFFKALDASRQEFEETGSRVKEFGTIAGGVANTFGKLNAVVGAAKQGFQQGGVLGAIGGVAGQFGDLPVVGPYIAAAGQILSFIGGLFTAQAKKIAEQVKKSFSDTVQSFQNGTTDLADTIVALEQQRQQAISQLSGKKGGQDQLNTILPQFDQEILALKKQQADLKNTFENQLTLLQLHSTTLSGIVQQWQQINQQVTDYIKAGGEAGKAAEFLSLQLEQIKESSQDQLSQGEQQAIQDAITLNGLLQQKVDLEKSYQQQVFDLTNADSIERQQAGAVTRGRQLADLKAQHDADEAAVDEQIDLANQKILLEGKVFNISTDISELHRRDEELTLQALSEQLQKYTDLKAIIDSINQGANGLFTSGLLQATPQQVNVNIAPISVTVTGLGDAGDAVADSLSNALAKQLRGKLA